MSLDRKLRCGPVKREAALAALMEIYPNGLPDNKVTVVTWNSVNRRLRELRKPTVSQKTIERALHDLSKLHR